MTAIFALIGVILAHDPPAPPNCPAAWQQIADVYQKQPYAISQLASSYSDETEKACHLDSFIKNLRPGSQTQPTGSAPSPAPST